MVHLLQEKPWFCKQAVKHLQISKLSGGLCHKIHSACKCITVLICVQPSKLAYGHVHNPGKNSCSLSPSLPRSLTLQWSQDQSLTCHVAYKTEYLCLTGCRRSNTHILVFLHGLQLLVLLKAPVQTASLRALITLLSVDQGGCCCSRETAW